MTNQKTFEDRLNSLIEKIKQNVPQGLPTGYTAIFTSQMCIRKYLRILDERPIKTYREIWSEWFQIALKKFATHLPREADFLEFITKQPTVQLKVQKKAENIQYREDFNQTQGNAYGKNQNAIELILERIPENLNYTQKEVFCDKRCINYYLDTLLKERDLECEYNDLFDDWLKLADDKGYKIAYHSFIKFMEFYKPKKTNEHQSSGSNKGGINKTSKVFQEQERNQLEYERSWVKLSSEELKEKEIWRYKDNLEFWRAWNTNKLAEDELEIVLKQQKIKESLPPLPEIIEERDANMNSNASLVAYSRYFNEIDNNIRLDLMPKDTIKLDLPTWFDKVYWKDRT